MTTTTAAEGLRNCFFLNTNKMASSTERFANFDFGEAETEKLLEDKDSLNTKRSTKASRIGKNDTQFPNS
jgi:hypothetical protein